MVSVKYLFARRLSPQKFGFNCDQKLELSSAQCPLKLSLHGKINAFCFRNGQKCPLNCEIRSASSFGKPTAAQKFDTCDSVPKNFQLKETEQTSPS